MSKAWGVVFAVLWITFAGLILKHGKAADNLLRTGGDVSIRGIKTLQA